MKTENSVLLVGRTVNSVKSGFTSTRKIELNKAVLCIKQSGKIWSFTHYKSCG